MTTLDEKTAAELEAVAGELDARGHRVVRRGCRVVLQPSPPGWLAKRVRALGDSFREVMGLVLAEREKAKSWPSPTSREYDNGRMGSFEYVEDDDGRVFRNVWRKV